MRRETFEPGDATAATDEQGATTDEREQGADGVDDLVLVMGWGNRLDHENVRWFAETLAGGGYRVHAFQIPVHVADFDAEYVDPVREYVADLDDYRLVGHSTGGLIAPYLDGATTRVYCSPWWGYPESMPDPVLDLVAALPVERPLIPNGGIDREAIGGLATDRQLREGPDRVSPAWVRETRRGHRELPPIDDDAVVFCTLRDEVVSVRAIGERVSADNVVLYDGGHELFSSRRREDYVDALLAAVDEGADALR